jgi:hypothetical protein
MDLVEAHTTTYFIAVKSLAGKDYKPFALLDCVWMG